MLGDWGGYRVNGAECRSFLGEGVGLGFRLVSMESNGKFNWKLSFAVCIW